MKLTKPELDELRKLNPPDDPRMFRRFIDTIDSLEAELAAARHSKPSNSAEEFAHALAPLFSVTKYDFMATHATVLVDTPKIAALVAARDTEARDREKAAIAAALRQAASVEFDEPTGCSTFVRTKHSRAAREAILAVITPDQSAALQRYTGAAIAAALAKAVETCVDGAVVAYKRGYKEHGDACHSCASRIRTLITTYQSAARGGASQNEPEPASENPPTTEGSART